MKRYFLLLAVLFPVLLSGQSYLGIEKELQRHVEYLADPALRGRKAGSEDEKKASAYIYKEMEKGGVTMLTNEAGQIFAVLGDKDTLWSQNIVGIVEGYDRNLKNEYIIVGAHYDHLGTNILNNNGKEELQVYRGADDNASGVAVLTELAKQVASQSFFFRRSVVFVAFGAEEIGMTGSWFFLNKGFKDADNIAFMINIDMVGRSGKGNEFVAYTLVPNPEMNSIFTGLTKYNFTAAPKVSGESYFPSDHIPFYEKKIPTVLFTTGLHRDYHSARDIPEHLNYNEMANIGEYLFHFVGAVANLDARIGQGVYSEQVTDRDQALYSQFDVDKAPTFMKGNESTFLNQWVYTYLKYPPRPLRDGIQGTVIVNFIVEESGAVTNVEVFKGVDEDLDKEAVRVISASPNWKPGEIAGRKVRVKYSLPVEFRLKKN